MAGRRRLGFTLFLAASLAVAGAVGLLGDPSSVDAATAPRCLGRAATIVGTPGDDAIRGTSGPDVIHGLGGNDLIVGFGGNDIICGGRGWDRLHGQAGNDRLVGGAGQDQLFGGAGRRDVCMGGTQSDRATRCEGRVSVRPFKLIPSQDPVTRAGVRRINNFRRANSGFTVPQVKIPTEPDHLAPLYVSTGHNRMADNLLKRKIETDVANNRYRTSRTFRFLPEFNSLGVIQSNCAPLAQRPTSALPGMISESLVASPEMKVLVTRPTSDRVGLAWQERNRCLYWVIVLGGPLVAP